MLNEKDSAQYVNTLTHYSHLEHESKMNKLIECEEFNLFQLLKPKISKNGNKWWVVSGKSIKEGIYGVGNSPYNAICDWSKKWYKKIEE